MSVVPLKIHVPLNLSNQFHVLDRKDYLRQKLRSFDLIFFHRNHCWVSFNGFLEAYNEVFSRKVPSLLTAYQVGNGVFFCTGYCMRQHRVQVECVCVGEGGKGRGGLQ